ncbi:NmrA family NAD(P)-binding protein [Streptomyces sp. NPDC004059]
MDQSPAVLPPATDTYPAVLGEKAVAFERLVRSADPGTPVVTCGSWILCDLGAHLGQVVLLRGSRVPSIAVDDFTRAVRTWGTTRPGRQRSPAGRDAGRITPVAPWPRGPQAASVDHTPEARMPPVLVTGAAGRVGAVGRTVVEGLRRRGLKVRALVRRDDDRAEALRATGAEVVVGDLTSSRDVAEALDGCGRVYFGMAVSEQYLPAAVTTAVAARAYGGLEAFVNMSQLTVSEMDLASTSESHQQRQQWLVEQLLGWSGLPVVQVRPTVFLENPLFQVGFSSILRDDTIRLPFGQAKTSPIAAHDVAAAVEEILADPARHVGRVYELTGPRSESIAAMAAEISAALGRTVGYTNVPLEQWLDHDLRALGLPDHVFQHISTMARLHAANRYDRQADGMEQIMGRPAAGVADYVRRNPELFTR